MEQAVSWEANSCTASQETCRIYGTRWLITVFTSARHLSLFWARSSQDTPFRPIALRSVWILPSRVRQGLPSGFLSVFPTGTLCAPVFFHIRATFPLHLIIFYLITRIIFSEEYKSSLCSLLQSPVTSSHLGQNIFLSTLFSNTLSLCSSLNVNTKFCTHTKQQAELQFCVFHSLYS
jgi:hypothetical protein